MFRLTQKAMYILSKGEPHPLWSLSRDLPHWREFQSPDLTQVENERCPASAEFDLEKS